MFLPPEDQRDWYAWASNQLAHVSIGAVSAALVVAVIGWPAWAAPVAYLIWWEIGAQRVGAGWRDALTDTLFIACGAAAIWSAWHQLAAPMFGAMVLASVSLGVGIWRRV